MSPAGASNDEEQLAEGTLLSHLIELRARLIRAAAAVLLIFIGLVPFAQQVFTFIATPLMERLPEDSSMIVTQVASPFLTPFKTCLFVAVFLAMPVVLYQAWLFIAPGLYRKEKRFAFPLLFASIALFYTGVAFAYFVVFPLMFTFFIGYAPEGVTVTPDIAQFLDFILTIFFAFGLAFEVPIVTVMSVWSGLVSTDSLKKARPYVFLGAFVAGMLLTPPDAVSQTLLAVPVYLLYECGLILARVLVARKDAAEDAGETGESAG